MTTKIMDSRTLDALKGSILKWEEIVAGKRIERGGSDCPLCSLFRQSSKVPFRAECEGCPVAAARGQSFCRGTPYALYVRFPTKANAQLEVDFLKSLLPKDRGSCVTHTETPTEQDQAKPLGAQSSTTRTMNMTVTGRSGDPVSVEAQYFFDGETGTAWWMVGGHDCDYRLCADGEVMQEPHSGA